MVQIIKENRKPTFAEQVNRGLGSGLDFLGEMQKNQDLKEAEERENAALERLTGLNLRDLSPQMKSLYFSEQMKGDRTKKDSSQNFQGALETIQQMKDIRKKGNLGIGTGFRSYFDSDTARDMGKYEQLGKSLISYASTIPIRNQREFNVLADKLFDPSIRDAEAEGILEGMEKIIRDSLGTSGSASMPQGSQNAGILQKGNSSEKTKTKPLKSFILK